MSEFISSRAWRRIERRALRGHDSDLQQHLTEIVTTASTVVDVDTTSTPGSVLVRLTGHRLAIGPVRGWAAESVVQLTRSAAEVCVTRAGRYGRMWWVAMTSATGEEVVLLGGRLQITHDRGRPVHIDLAQPHDREPALSH